MDAGLIPEIVHEWYSSLLCHTNTLLHLLGEIRAVATPFGYRAAGSIPDTDLQRLEQPVLYLWGDHDNFATPEQAEHLCSLSPGTLETSFALQEVPEIGVVLQ